MFEDLKVRAERMAAEAKAHTESCKEPFCDRCRRFQCTRKVDGVRCGRAAMPDDDICQECDTAQCLERWRKWALEAVPFGFRAQFTDQWLIDLVGADTISLAQKTRLMDDIPVAALGPPGSGKSTLVAAMVMSPGWDGGGAMIKRPAIAWVSAHDLARARAQHSLGAGEAPLIAKALAAGLLVVDELGGEDQRYASAVAEVLYERHAHKRQTWTTTGVGPKEIADRYGGGIARRVFEDAEVFRLKGRRR